MANPTGQIIVNAALTALGILEQGGVPNASDSTASLDELNAQWDGWGIDEGLIYGNISVPYAWGAAQPTQSIGPTGQLESTPAPTRIHEAYFVKANQPRTKIQIVPRALFFAHSDLSASTTGAPEQLYADWDVLPSGGNPGDFNLFAWPVPANAWTLELEQAVPFAAWTLNAAYALPPGYQDAIQKALAYRLLSQYGVAVQPSVADVITKLGIAAEARLREMNKINRMLAQDSERAPGTPPQQQAAGLGR